MLRRECGHMKLQSSVATVNVPQHQNTALASDMMPLGAYAEQLLQCMDGSLMKSAMKSKDLLHATNLQRGL